MTQGLQKGGLLSAIECHSDFCLHSRFLSAFRCQAEIDRRVHLALKYLAATSSYLICNLTKLAKATDAVHKVRSMLWHAPVCADNCTCLGVPPDYLSFPRQVINIRNITKEACRLSLLRIRS